MKQIPLVLKIHVSILRLAKKKYNVMLCTVTYWCIKYLSVKSREYYILFGEVTIHYLYKT